MAKTIESFGIPAVHVCSITPISMAVGANRIVPATGIPYPTGNPNLEPEQEYNVRMKLVQKALKAMTTDIEEQTIFE